MALLAVLTSLNASLVQTTFVLAQEDEDAASNAGTALVVFLVVMIVVVGVLAALQQRRKTLLTADPETDERGLDDEHARRESFESKMRRVEERLRGQDDAVGSSDPSDSPAEAGPSPELE